MKKHIDPEVRQGARELFGGEPIPNDETRKAIEDARNGVGLSRGFTSVSELFEELDSDD